MMTGGQGDHVMARGMLGTVVTSCLHCGGAGPNTSSAWEMIMEYPCANESCHKWGSFVGKCLRR